MKLAVALTVFACLPCPLLAMEFTALPLNAPSFIEAKGEVRSGDTVKLGQMLKRYPQI
jgi:hypothetical protein